MPDISSIGPGAVGPVDHSPPNGFRREERQSAAGTGAPPARPGDRVELSDHARYLDRLRQLPGQRAPQINTIRESIAEGTYDTEDKLGAAIDELIEDLLTD